MNMDGDAGRRQRPEYRRSYGISDVVIAAQASRALEVSKSAEWARIR